MIIVVTGQPRHGKTQYAIKLLLDLIKQNDKREKNGLLPRDIFCDIAGVNAPDTPTKLPVKNQWEVFGDANMWFGEHNDPDIPEGYICPNKGSVFIYDECHKVDWIKDSTGALSKNPTTISMNEHGHEDYIFILITQFPKYIHTHLHGLVEYHYHVKRFSGLKTATVYKWNEFKTSPRSKTAIADIFEKDKFVFNKKYYNCYKSASAHDSMKFKLPKEWAYAIGLIVFLASAMLWRYYHSPVSQMVAGENILTANQLAQQRDTVDNPMLSDQPLDVREQQILDMENEIQELREKYMQAHIIELSKHDDILPTAIIANDKRCWALNKYGERLNIDEALCRVMSTDSTMMPHSRQSIDDNDRRGSRGNDDMTIRQVEPIRINSLG